MDASRSAHNSEPLQLLTALQLGDSLFPSGATAFSWGLETLVNERSVGNADQVERFVVGQLRWRWAVCDSSALRWSHRCGDQLDSVAELDHELEAMSLARELREGARRLGSTLLKIHAEIGTPNAGAYLERVRTGQAPGQLSVVQGLVGRACGLSEGDSAAVSGYGLASNLVAAALRLGVIGHRDAQRVLSRARPVIAAALAAPLAPRQHWYNATPMVEIAAMRHESGSARLFAN